MERRSFTLSTKATNHRIVVFAHPVNKLSIRHELILKEAG
jgi:hypothetical protein